MQPQLDFLNEFTISENVTFSIYLECSNLQNIFVPQDACSVYGEFGYCSFSITYLVEKSKA